MALGKKLLLRSLGFCHQAAEALTRWQHSEETVSRVIVSLMILTALLLQR